MALSRSVSTSSRRALVGGGLILLICSGAAGKIVQQKQVEKLQGSACCSPWWKPQLLSKETCWKIHDELSHLAWEKHLQAITPLCSSYQMWRRSITFDPHLFSSCKGFSLLLGPRLMFLWLKCQVKIVSLHTTLQAPRWHLLPCAESLPVQHP